MLLESWWSNRGTMPCCPRVTRRSTPSCWLVQLRPICFQSRSLLIARSTRAPSPVSCVRGRFIGRGLGGWFSLSVSRGWGGMSRGQLLIFRVARFLLVGRERLWWMGLFLRMRPGWCMLGSGSRGRFVLRTALKPAAARCGCYLRSVNLGSALAQKKTRMDWAISVRIALLL